MKPAAEGFERIEDIDPRYREWHIVSSKKVRARMKKELVRMSGNPEVIKKIIAQTKAYEENSEHRGDRAMSNFEKLNEFITNEDEKFYVVDLTGIM